MTIFGTAMTRRDAARALALGAGALALGAAPVAAQEQAAATQAGTLPWPTEPLTLGGPNALVEVIEYASFTCPHCARFAKVVYPELKKAYIDTGKIRLTIREVYFDKLGLWASTVARCGGEGRYFGYVELLYERQEQWVRADKPVDELVKLARLGGVGADEASACMNSEDFRKALVEKYAEYYQDPLLTGTPTLIVDGEKVESPSFENLSAAIEKRLAS